MAAIELTRQNFETEALRAEDTVLVDFWASWCGPCRMLLPIVEQIADEKRAGLKVCRVNVDEQPALAERFDVMSIPTLIVFQGGKPVRSSVGVQSKRAILEMAGQA